MDYSQLFEKMRKLNKKIKGISKPFHYMPKKTRTINQGRRAINAIISNIIGADCKKNYKICKMNKSFRCILKLSY